MFNKNSNCLYYVTQDSNTPNFCPINLEKECGLKYIGYDEYDTGHMRRVEYYKLPDNTFQLIKVRKDVCLYVDNKTGKATTLETDSWRINAGRLPTEEEYINDTRRK